LPETELIYGVKAKGESKLFNALGPVVNEKQGYSTGGVGCYMADFLTSRMYRDTLSLQQCIILAAYVLFQAKEHVEGCGGHSQIAALRNNESSGTLGWEHTRSFTDLVQAGDVETSSILLEFADLQVDDSEFKTRSLNILNDLITSRNHEKDKMEEWQKMWDMLGTVEVDDLGFPILKR
jgi:hypothetical protein